MRAFSYPFHLIVIVAGAAAVAAVLWGVEPSGAHFASYGGGLVALLATVDLARKLGLEPKDDPARRDRRETN
jgi:hypothetical protein